MPRHRIDAEITDPQVEIWLKGQQECVPTADAIRLAHEQGKHLVEEFEQRLEDPPDESPPRCVIQKLAQPIHWESLGGELPTWPPEPKLWFEPNDPNCECTKHYLMRNAHTFLGRLRAHCPANNRAYCVSASDIMGACSEQTAYFVRGFLEGCVPNSPTYDSSLSLDEERAHELAWWRARRLFGETGHWYRGFQTCSCCGARLLPSNTTDVCWSICDTLRSDEPDSSLSDDPQ